MLSNLYRCMALQAFSKIERGSIELIEKYKKKSKKIILGGKVFPDLKAVIEIHNPEFFKRIILCQEVGFGEAYVDKLWSSTDLETLWLILSLNRDIIEKSIPILGYLNPGYIKNKINRLLRAKNTVENNRAQVGYAYDVGNDFFEWMLGDSMLYTCAVWNENAKDLEAAQQNKLNILTSKLKTEVSHKVLDIGMGWGTLANHLHQKTGCDVVGISLSQNQVDYCKKKFPNLTFEYQDYREVKGQYDRIISVGMLEHVGEEKYLKTYFEKIASLLNPGGRAVIQTMTDRELLIDSGRVGPTFGTKYIMPNVILPTDKKLRDTIFSTNKLTLIHWEDFGPHYGRTSQHWRKNLIQAKEGIIRHYSERLFDTYDYNWAWFSSCFTTGLTGLVQMVIEKRPISSNSEIGTS